MPYGHSYAQIAWGLAISVELNVLGIGIGFVSKPKQSSQREWFGIRPLDYRRPQCKNADWNSILTISRGRKRARYADMNHYAISAKDSPTYCSKWKNVHPDMLDIFLRHMGLPVVDVEILDELNSDHSSILLTIGSSMTCLMFRSTGHFVRWDEFRRYLSPIKIASDFFCPLKHSNQASKSWPTLWDLLSSQEQSEGLMRPYNTSLVLVKLYRIMRQCQRFKPYGLMSS